MGLPITAATKSEAEERLGIPIKWEYEWAKRLPGLRSHFNHDGRWLGLTTGGIGLCVAHVYEDLRPPARVYTSHPEGD